MRYTYPGPGYITLDLRHKIKPVTERPTEPAMPASPTGVSIVMDLSQRHPGTAGIARFFDYEHLPARLQEISGPCHDLAEVMIRNLPDGPELTAGLRKLLEAKDCFVRAAL